MPRSPKEIPTEPLSPTRRANGAAVQRARRLTLTYLVGLSLIFLLFATLSRFSSVGGSSGAIGGLVLFGEIALALGTIGVLVGLSSAPVAVERTPEALVVHGLLGYRRTFPAGEGLSTRIVRRYPAGWLSAEPVESVEVASRGVHRTYWFEAGLVPEESARSVGP